MTEQSIPARVPAGATPEGDGVVVGDGPAWVDAYIDFQCPYCRRFELAAGPTLAGLAGQHLASVAYHPMNFLDAASTTAYSTRAAAASGCAADFGRFPEYAHELFTHQPPEGGPGLSDAELAALGQAAGLGGTGFAGCLAAGRVPGLAVLRDRAGGGGGGQRHPHSPGRRGAGPARPGSDRRRGHRRRWPC